MKVYMVFDMIMQGEQEFSNFELTVCVDVISRNDRGRMSAITHFDTQLWDGQGRDSAQRSAPASLHADIPSGPTSLLVGVSPATNHPDKFVHPPVSNYVTSAARKKYLEQAKHELQAHDGIQRDEIKRRVEQEKMEFSKPIGDVMESEINNDKIRSSRFAYDISNNKNLERTRNPNQAATHPSRERAPFDTHYRDELYQQMGEEQGKKIAEKQWAASSGDRTMGEYVTNHRISPNPKHASYMNKPELTPEQVAERKEKSAHWREGLDTQIEDANKRRNEQPLDGYSAFTPIVGPHQPIQRHEDKFEKVTDTPDGMNPLHSRQTQNKTPFTATLGNFKGQGKIQKFSADEMDKKRKMFEERKKMLDDVQNERVALQQRLKGEDLELEYEYLKHPIIKHTEQPIDGKLKSFTINHGEILDDEVKAYRQNELNAYKNSLSGVEQEKRKYEILQRQKEDDYDRKDHWKWNKDLVTHKNHLQSVRGPQYNASEIEQYHQQLAGQLHEKSELQHQQEDVNYDAEMSHMDNSIAMKLSNSKQKKDGRGPRMLAREALQNDEACVPRKTTGTGVKSIIKEVMVVDAPGTKTKRLDHVGDLLATKGDYP